MIKRILVAVSGTPELNAKINYTLDLAKRHQARVQLISIVDVARLSEVGPIPIGAGHFAGKMAKKRVTQSYEISEKALAIFAEACEKENVPVEVLRHEGDPILLIAAMWRYADICILGARGWFDHDVLPDPEMALGQLIASGVRPLIAVHETFKPVERVMICYSGALESAKAMKQYVQISPYPNAKIEIVCTAETKSGEDPQHLVEEAAEYVALHGYEVTTNVVGGAKPSEILQNHANDTNTDLIVMGGSYQRILFSKRFGATTIGIVRESPLPLFISH